MTSFKSRPHQQSTLPIIDTLSNETNVGNTVLPYLSMLRIFAAQITTPELSPEERMQTWIVLMRLLNNPTTA
jgi:hypothetical protein